MPKFPRQPPSASSLSFFLLRSTLYAICGIRDGVQAGLGDRSIALLAPAIAAVVDPLDCCFNLVEDAFVASEQSKREFLIGLVIGKFFHVGRYADGLAVILILELFGLTNGA